MDAVLLIPPFTYHERMEHSWSWIYCFFCKEKGGYVEIFDPALHGISYSQTVEVLKIRRGLEGH